MAVLHKTNRIDFRIDDESKALIETAAELNHLSISAYISSIVIKQAEIDVRNNENLLLNEKDADLILSLLEKEEAPNENLIRLMK